MLTQVIFLFRCSLKNTDVESGIVEGNLAQVHLLTTASISESPPLQSENFFDPIRRFLLKESCFLNCQINFADVFFLNIFFKMTLASFLHVVNSQMFIREVDSLFFNLFFFSL